MIERWLPEALPERAGAGVPTPLPVVPQPAGVSQPAELARYSLPIIDHTMIAELRALSTPGTIDALEEITQVYIKNSRDRIARMKAALNCGEGSGIVIEAHSMKSSSGNVGAVRLAPLCREIEERAKSGKLDGLGPMIERLSQEFEEACTELERLIAKGPSDSGAEAA